MGEHGQPGASRQDETSTRSGPCPPTGGGNAHTALSAGQIRRPLVTTEQLTSESGERACAPPGGLPCVVQKERIHSQCRAGASRVGK
jgi:hypothetical protein